MTRRVCAIAIEGDQTHCPGTPTPGATEAVDVLVADLAARFAGNCLAIERLRDRPTNRAVHAAFTRMRALLAPGDLFIVMFAGHGAELPGWDEAQVWALADGETFTDGELATELRALGCDVDCVVISDCCYGGGFFERGTPLPDPDNLAQSTAYSAQPENGPMVCISAANEDELVTLTKLLNLARETVAAANAELTYAELAAAFAKFAVTGRTFRVEARPRERIHHRVLSTRAPCPSGEAARTTMIPAAVSST